MGKIRISSAAERRSLNTEAPIIGKETQLQIWGKLCGQWENDRSARQIIDEIIESRTLGREVEL